MADYDHIAPYYDVLHASRKQTAKYIQHLIKMFNPNATTLLDLACGTGALMKQFSRNYTVSGLDISPGMLKVAKKRLVKARFYQENMCHFDLQQRFDVITCLYCSLNHVLVFDDWCAMFKAAKKHLTPGGIFIFDVMTETGLYNMVLNSPLLIKRFNQLSIGEISMAETGDYSLWRARGYRRWFKTKRALYDVTVKQAAFSTQRIYNALSAEFSQVYMDDPEQGEASERSESICFLAQYTHR